MDIKQLAHRTSDSIILHCTPKSFKCRTSSCTFPQQPKLSTANDPRINGQAKISFNNLAPILTDPVFITLDNDAPTSKVATAIANGTNINVTWAGTDASSGLAAYDVYVSIDGGEYQIWQNRTIDTSGTYVGEAGKTYSFYSVATDNVDRLEFKTPLAETSVSLDGVAITPISYTINTNKTTLPEGNSGSTPVTFTINRSGTINVASSISYAVTGTATNNTDYNIAGIAEFTGALNFVADEASKTITLNVLGDATVENDENIVFTLSAPSITTPASTIVINTATTIIQNDDVVPVVTTPKLLKNPNETFTLKDGRAIQFTLQNSLVQTVNELAAFTVDDAQGLIDGIAPGAAGYAEKAIGRARTIFSTIANNPNGFDQKLSSQILPFSTDGNLAFLYLKNNSIDNIKAGGVSNNLSSILFAQGNLDSIINEGVATLNWKDTNGAAALPELVASAVAIGDVPSTNIALTSKILDLSQLRLLLSQLPSASIVKLPTITQSVFTKSPMQQLAALISTMMASQIYCPVKPVTPKPRSPTEWQAPTSRHPMAAATHLTLLLPKGFMPQY
jgi:Calx-beta domain